MKGGADASPSRVCQVRAAAREHAAAAAAARAAASAAAGRALRRGGLYASDVPSTAPAPPLRANEAPAEEMSADARRDAALRRQHARRRVRKLCRVQVRARCGAPRVRRAPRGAQRRCGARCASVRVPGPRFRLSLAYAAEILAQVQWHAWRGVLRVEAAHVCHVALRTTHQGHGMSMHRHGAPPCTASASSQSHSTQR